MESEAKCGLMCQRGSEAGRGREVNGDKAPEYSRRQGLLMVCVASNGGVISLPV